MKPETNQKYNTKNCYTVGTTVGTAIVTIGLLIAPQQPSNENIHNSFTSITQQLQNNPILASKYIDYLTTPKPEKILKLNKALNKARIFDNPFQIEKGRFLKEIVEDFISSENTLLDTDTTIESFTYALEFLLDMPRDYKVPVYDIHPDGEFSLVWYGKYNNILSVAFSSDGYLRYSYFSAKDNVSNKGSFPISGIKNEDNSELPKAFEIFVRKISQA